MKLLLDTHVFMWMEGDPARLTPTASTLLQDPANTLLLSVVSVWEIVIKQGLGKLAVGMPLATILAQQQSNGLIILDITLPHVLALQQLPPIHKDPFDRLLIAQAQCENATFLTADTVLAAYPVPVRW